MQDYFFIRTDRLYVRVNFCDIIYIEGRRNYLKIVTGEGNHLVLMTMKRLQELLPSSLFLRIHKSYIVALDKVLAFDSRTVFLKNIELPLGEIYKQNMERSVTIASGESAFLIPIHGAYQKKQVLVG